MGPGLRAGAKSVFILPFVLGTGGVAFVAANELATQGFHLAWFGALLAGGAVQAFLAWTIASGAARTSTNLPPLWIFATFGAVLAWAGQVLSGPAPFAALSASAAAAGTIGYVFWYSRFGRNPSPALKIGARLPDFSLEDTEGDVIASQRLISQPTVLLFYRGNWCPLCMAQVREVAAAYREIAARGAQVIAISPQPHENAEALAAQFEAPIRFLVDPDAHAARRLGIAHLGGLPAGMQVLGYDSDTVLPTVVITDGDRNILFADQTDNYRVRPDPETFLALLPQQSPTEH